MKPLRFDFAPRSSRPSLPRRLGVGLACGAAAAALLYFSLQTRALREVESDLMALTRTATAAPAPRRSPEADRTARALTAMQARLALPLPTILRSLQAPPDAGKGLSVVGLELAAADGTRQVAPKVRITAHADSLLAAAEYLQHLSRQPSLTDVRIVRHEYLSDRSVARVQFVIELAWVGHEGT